MGYLTYYVGYYSTINVGFYCSCRRRVVFASPEKLYILRYCSCKGEVEWSRWCCSHYLHCCYSLARHPCGLCCCHFAAAQCPLKQRLVMYSIRCWPKGAVCAVCILHPTGWWCIVCVVELRGRLSQWYKVDVRQWQGETTGDKSATSITSPWQ